MNPVLRKASAVMDPLYKSSPGLSSSLLVVAKIKFLSGMILRGEEGRGGEPGEGRGVG